jgi:serine/threonine-protein kinase
MSPEQATADKEITGRSDVYSLASVLYEMLTGNPPHTGATAQQIIMKIIAEPAQPVTALRKSVPPHIAATLAKSLEKLPADRFASAHEFAEALQGRGVPVLAGTGAVKAPREPIRSRLRDPVVLGLAALLVITSAVAAWQWAAARRPTSQPVIRFPIDLPRYVSTGLPIGSGLAISEDGGTIAYIGGAEGLAGQHALVRTVDEIRSRPIPGTEEAQSLFLSPDGNQLGFWAKGRLSKVALDGGATVTLGDSLAEFGGASWSRSGVIVASLGGQLLTISDSGGTFQPLSSASPPARDEYQLHPLVLADGQTVVYTRSSRALALAEASRLAIASLTTGLTRSLDLVGNYALGVVDGYLVYTTGTNQLMAVKFDADEGRATGIPTLVGNTLPASARGAPRAALATAGALVYQSGARTSEVVLVHRRGVAHALLTESRVYTFPRFSPDGKRIAVSVEVGARRDIWLYDRDAETFVRVTDDGSSERPEFTPDGKRILYRTVGSMSNSSIWSRPTDRSGPATPFFANGNEGLWEAVMTSDGATVVLQHDDSRIRNSTDVVLRSVAGDTTMIPVSVTAAAESQARPSPDGRWVAFQSNASGTNQVVVRSLHGQGGQVVVSTAFGTEPVWSRDGKRLFYRDGTQFMEVAFTTSPEFAVTSRRPLFADPFVFAPSPHANYDASPDGATFVALRATEGAQLVVVHNWRSELRRQLASRQQ